MQSNTEKEGTDMSFKVGDRVTPVADERVPADTLGRVFIIRKVNPRNLKCEAADGGRGINFPAELLASATDENVAAGKSSFGVPYTPRELFANGQVVTLAKPYKDITRTRRWSSARTTAGGWSTSSSWAATARGIPADGAERSHQARPRVARREHLMRYVLALILAMALGGAVENAEASNVGAAHERMAAALPHSQFEWGGYGHGYKRQLLMKEGSRWVPVQLSVTCRAASCIGLISAEETKITALEDHARFTGRKGTYHETGWAVPESEPIAAAIALAIRYWGTAPCGGQVAISVTTPPANDENGGKDASMWSSWDGGTNDENNESAPQPFFRCSIGINRAVWTSIEFMAYTAWPEFSIDVIHEFGHLLGHTHSTEVQSVMYPEPSADEVITGATAPGWSYFVR